MKRPISMVPLLLNVCTAFYQSIDGFDLLSLNGEMECSPTVSIASMPRCIVFDKEPDQFLVIVFRSKHQCRFSFRGLHFGVYLFREEYFDDLEFLKECCQVQWRPTIIIWCIQVQIKTFKV